MKRLNIFLLPLMLMSALVLTSCKDSDDTTLTAVTSLSYEPTMGGAIISFTPPANNDLLYVKAAYVNSLGERVFRSTSIYDKKIEIDGLADETKSYPVEVSAIDKWGGETSATVINVQPGRSYINIIKDNLQIHPMCGGLSVEWENPAGVSGSREDISIENPGKAVYVVIDYTDAEGQTRTRYLTSKLKRGRANLRGLFAGTYGVSFHVEDFSGNQTAQSAVQTMDVPEETEFLKFIERDDPVSGLVKEPVWTIVERVNGRTYTTLQEAWENRNAAICDGIIDSNTKNTQNYAGTDAGASAVTYGASLPWDTDQMDIVVDLHQVVSISRLKAWQRCYKYGTQPYSGREEQQTSGISDDYNYYQGDNLKRFKLYGSMVLEDDDQWFLIQDCDISSNSTAGTLPVYWTNPDYFGHEQYMPDNASYQYAIDGHEWELTEMSAPVRYIRVRFVENWDLSQRNVSGLSELTLFGELLVSPEELKNSETVNNVKSSKIKH